MANEEKFKVVDFYDALECGHWLLARAIADWLEDLTLVEIWKIACSAEVTFAGRDDLRDLL